MTAQEQDDYAAEGARVARWSRLKTACSLAQGVTVLALVAARAADGVAFRAFMGQIKARRAQPDVHQAKVCHCRGES